MTGKALTRLLIVAAANNLLWAAFLWPDAAAWSFPVLAGFFCFLTLGMGVLWVVDN